jgi:hypothetical protein
MPIETAWRDIPLLGPRRRPTVRSVGRGSRRRWISRVRAVFPVSRYGLRGCGTHSRVRIESQTLLSLPVAGVPVKRLRTSPVPLSAHWSTSATFLAGACDVRPRLQHLRGCPGCPPVPPRRGAVVDCPSRPDWPSALTQYRAIAGVLEFPAIAGVGIEEIAGNENHQAADGRSRHPAHHEEWDRENQQQPDWVE